MRSENRKRNRDFKNSMAGDLRAVAEVLFQANLIRDTSPLLSAAGRCTRPDPEGNYWWYECTGLILVVDDRHLGEYRDTIPGKLREIEIELNVRAGGRCWERYSCDDPFDTLEVDCKIEARAQGGPFVCAWHLDRSQGDTHEASQHFVHPCYHFQFGGRRLPKELGYGRLLFIEPPRLAHPPLDAILAVDFVLTNYFPDTWRELRSNQRYARVVERAQHWCWRPYANVTASRWTTEDPSWTAETIWPQLIPRVLPER